MDKLYVSKKKKDRGIAIIEDSVDKSIRHFEEYMKKGNERLITTTRNNTRTHRTTTTKKHF